MLWPKDRNPSPLQAGNFERETINYFMTLYTKRDQKREIECRLGLKNLCRYSGEVVRDLAKISSRTT